MGACLAVQSDKPSYAGQVVSKGSPESETIIPSVQSAQFRSISIYQLNDLRSLEGVSRLWSEKLQNQTENEIIKTQNSMPIGDSQQSGVFSPISISMYYFMHAQKSMDQPNFSQSHSSPYHGPRTNSNVHSSLQCNQIDENKENEPFVTEQSDGRTDVLSELPHLSIIPVFSNSSSTQTHSHLHSPPGLLSPIAFNMSASPHEHSPLYMEQIMADFTDNDSGSIVPIKHTYTNKNLFTLNSNDFMEYQSMNSNQSTFNIGSGASGIVTKAFHFSSCKMVAIKQCRSKTLMEVKAFKKEAKIYEEFEDNSYIIDSIGFGEDDDKNALMALEYMDLGSIESLDLQNNITNIKQRELIVGYIALNVLRALSDFHSELYVHNDIKPANILANKYGEIKLSDFGTVLQLKKDSDFLQKNNGTQKYQSPEKMIFNVKYNQKTDIWSLGITIYELLFGVRKELKENDISYTTNPPKLDPSVNGCDLSVNCCDFINQCLTINQFERPSANDLLSHPWFIENIEPISIKAKWPWVIETELLIKQNCNEDLLFMISALIIYYSTMTFDDTNRNNGSIHGLHRRVSVCSYSDEQRIENMAKYALCSKDIVLDRIQVTVSYIKSQCGI